MTTTTAETGSKPDHVVNQFTITLEQIKDYHDKSVQDLRDIVTEYHAGKR